MQHPPRALRLGSIRRPFQPLPRLQNPRPRSRPPQGPRRPEGFCPPLGPRSAAPAVASPPPPPCRPRSPAPAAAAGRPATPLLPPPASRCEAPAEVSRRPGRAGRTPRVVFRQHPPTDGHMDATVIQTRSKPTDAYAPNSRVGGALFRVTAGRTCCCLETCIRRDRLPETRANGKHSAHCTHRARQLMFQVKLVQLAAPGQQLNWHRVCGSQVLAQRLWVVQRACGTGR